MRTPPNDHRPRLRQIPRITATDTMSKQLTGDRLKHITIKGKRLNELPQLPILDTMELQGDLKDLSKANYEKLVKTHLKYGIFLPFHVWESPEGINYIADGHQRRRVLPNEGYTGNVPVVYIEAANRQEAKEKLLVISSQYGRITQEGYDEFTFDLPDIGDIVNFDALSFAFGDDRPEQEESADAEPQTPDDTFMVIVECGGEDRQIELFDRLESEGYKCRLLVS